MDLGDRQQRHIRETDRVATVLRAHNLLSDMMREKGKV
jgi:hypothetical protein